MLGRNERKHTGRHRHDRAAIGDNHTTFEAVTAAAKAHAKEVGDGKKTARVKAIEKVPAELAKYKQFVEEHLDTEQEE